MDNIDPEYKILQGTGDISYDYELLCKYHVLTEQISKSLASSLNFQNNLFKDFNTPNSKIRDAKYKFFAFQNYSSHQIFEVIDFSRFDSEGFVMYNTLRYIIQKYIENEYSMFFIRVDDYLNISDAEANKRNLIAAQFAYDNLKELRNLLLMRESSLDSVGIVLDLRNEEGKKQKDYQVVIETNKIKLNIINKQIEEVMSVIHCFSNEYLPSYKFAGVKDKDLTSSFVSEIFEPIQKFIESAGKKSSAKRLFKGLVIKVVQDFVKKEGMHYKDGEIDEREQKVIAYDLLMKAGFIDIDLIKSHKNRDGRIKYMESIPPYKDDYRAVKISDFQ